MFEKRVLPWKGSIFGLGVVAFLSFSVVSRTDKGGEALGEETTIKSSDSSVGKWDYLWAWSNEEVASAGENFWPQYRGPRGDGFALPDANPPIEWGEEKNVAWKTTIPGKAWSSPVVWGNHIWLTNATEDGKTMSALCIEFETGKIVWDRVIFTNTEVQEDYHEFNSYGSPTPILDQNHLFVSFGAYGTACLNRETGEKIWERRDLPCNHYRGAGASPILFRNSLIFHMDGYDYQYLIALDRKTGDTLWKQDRTIEYGTDNGDLKKAYGTPHVIEVENGSAKELQLISPAAMAILAYDPVDGKELWRIRHKEHSAAIRPLFDGKWVFSTTGVSRAKLVAISPDARGDITDSGVHWIASRAIGGKPSPLLIADRIYTVEDRGVISAIDKTTGETVWQKRLGGDFSSSPIYAGGRIYSFDEQGKSHVVNTEGDVLAVNTLPAGSMANPVAVGKTLLVRTREAIYAFRE